jgi:hypothetical protein
MRRRRERLGISAPVSKVLPGMTTLEEVLRATG